MTDRDLRSATDSDPAADPAADPTQREDLQRVQDDAGIAGEPQPTEEE